MSDDKFLTKEDIKKIPILEVAQTLGMDMINYSRNEYYWKEHDSFKVNTQKNVFNWYSRDIGGDVIKLVQTIKDVSYKDAIRYLKTGKFDATFTPTQSIKEPFKYTLAPYETDFSHARNYLKNIRSLSDETIDFFLSKGLLSSANKKHQDGYMEEVIVFKYLDQNNKMIGGSLQGIISNTERYVGKGYLKQIMYNSDGYAGMNVSIGTPKQLIFFEAPIDLMSYYDLNKTELKDVRLIAMEGLKERTISRYFSEYLLESTQSKDDMTLSEKTDLLQYVAQHTTYFETDENKERIVIAVDNDDAGRNFVDKLIDEQVAIKVDLPGDANSVNKVDWNDILIEMNNINKIETPLAVENVTVESKEELFDNFTKEETINTIENAPEMNQGQKVVDRGKNMDSLQIIKSEGSIVPDTLQSVTFEQTVTSHPTSPYPLLHFSTDGIEVQRRERNYHIVNDSDFRRVNQYAHSIQSVATWYKENISNTKLYYIFHDEEDYSVLTIAFNDDNFIHLTGIMPIDERKKAGDFLNDFIEGKGHYANLLISHALKEKLQVLPMLSDILDSKAFVLDDLSSVEKLSNLDLTKAIKSKDEDFLLLFKGLETEMVPASLMKLKGKLKQDVQVVDKKIILGIYREKAGKIEQLSINTDYIKDGGKELFNLLLKQNEEIILKESINEKPGKIFSELSGKNDIPINNSLQNILETNDTKALSNHLIEGIRSYRNSEQYKNFLDAMSKFHHYSVLNTQMIISQNPNASLVASYQDWKNKFDRHVKKGEKGIKIRVPVQKIKKDDMGNPILDEQGNIQKVTYFKIGTVFDVSQTEGKEIPKPIYLLKDSVIDYENLYRATRMTANENKTTIIFSDTKEANGFYNLNKNQIVISNRGMSESQIMKTLFHELAHATLHQNVDRTNLSLIEVEAESIAYIVSNHFNIDTSEYSFGYLNSWLNEMTDLEKVLGNIQQTSKNLIEKIDMNLERIKSKHFIKDKFQDKLQQAVQKQEQKQLNRGEDMMSKKLPPKVMSS